MPDSRISSPTPGGHPRDGPTDVENRPEHGGQLSGEEGVQSNQAHTSTLLARLLVEGGWTLTGRTIGDLSSRVLVWVV